MSIEFWVTALVVTATPGTGVLFTVAAGIARGTRASLVAAAGCTLGIVPHMAAAIFGAAALLQASGTAFAVMKWLGVAYLLYMAWSTVRETGALAVPTDGAPPSAAKTIVSAVLVNLLNPKLTIFFFAFLPQFVSPGESRSVLRMLELSGYFMLITLVVFAGYGIFAALVREKIVNRPCVLAWIRRVFAGSFVVLSGRLALTRQ